MPEAVQGQRQVWRVRGVHLPEGREPEEWWVADGVCCPRPISGVCDLADSWFLPGGLVDAHTPSR